MWLPSRYSGAVAVTRKVVAATAVVGAVTLAVTACTTADQGSRSRSPDTFALPTAAGTPTGPSPTGADPRPAGTGAAHVADRSGPFTLVVTMRSGTIRTNVAPLSVSSNEPVDPPHNTAAQWNTAAWIEQSTYPSMPGKGTAYVYAHACHHHLCPFTSLKDARVGDRARVTTAAGSSVYTIERIGLSTKSASSLPSWAADSTAPNRIVLVTCAFEQGDTSTSNIVVVARLDR